jgi:hypothetical protein
MAREIESRRGYGGGFKKDEYGQLWAIRSNLANVDLLHGFFEKNRMTKLGEFLLLGNCLRWAFFENNQSSTYFALLFSTEKVIYLLFLRKNWLGRFVRQLIWSP